MPAGLGDLYLRVLALARAWGELAPVGLVLWGSLTAMALPSLWAVATQHHGHPDEVNTLLPGLGCSCWNHRQTRVFQGGEPFSLGSQYKCPLPGTLFGHHGN